MGYTMNHLDDEAEFDLASIEGRIKYLSGLYMSKRNKKACLMQLRAWFPGPEKTHCYWFECTRGKEVLEKTRVQPAVWEAMTNGKKTEFMGNGVEFFTIKEFIPS
jgi:hypothetical protein